jgi:hypothetical protein
MDVVSLGALHHLHWARTDSDIFFVYHKPQNDRRPDGGSSGDVMFNIEPLGKTSERGPFDYDLKSSGLISSRN